MSKIEILGPKDLLPEVLKKIHEEGCLHIEDITHEAEAGRYFVRPMSLEVSGQEKKKGLEEVLVRVNSLIHTLPAIRMNERLAAEKEAEAQREWGEDIDSLLAEAESDVAALEDTVRNLSAEKRDLLAEDSNLARYQVVINKVAPLAGKLVALDNYESLALLVEKKFADLVQVIRQEVDRITDNQSHLVAEDVDENSIAVFLVFHNKYSRQVRSFVSGESVNEVVVPEGLRSVPYDEALRRVEKRRQQIPHRLRAVERQLADLSRSWYLKLLTHREVLRDKLDEMEVISEFGATEYTFVILGWMPTKYVQTCRRRLVETFGDKILMQDLMVSEHDAENAPIQYVHSSFVRAFEPVVQMFGTPRYGTVDPVPLVAIFFPLFFGIILGDMGYALVLLAVAAALHFRKKTPIGQGLSMILFASGLSSFFFGFAYGEFFGSFGRDMVVKVATLLSGSRMSFKEMEEMLRINVFGISFPWNREELLMPTLIFTVGLGGAHIVLGLILGMVNGWRGHSKKHVLEKGATLVALVALAPIIYTMMAGTSSKFSTLGWLLLIAALPVLVYSAGVMGPIEVLGTLANIVSYARIMAIGLVSVVLAETANRMGGTMQNVILGILIAVLIHALNLAIHVFTPSLHVLRLNFVEFFGKFYEAGGKPYKPFRRGGET